MYQRSNISNEVGGCESITLLPWVSSWDRCLLPASIADTAVGVKTHQEVRSIPAKTKLAFHSVEKWTINCCGKCCQLSSLNFKAQIQNHAKS